MNSHSHKCQGCGWVWTHSDSCAGDQDAHTCEKCGDVVFRLYHGLDVPASHSHSCQPIPPLAPLESLFNAMLNSLVNETTNHK